MTTTLTNDQITAGAAVLANNGKREGFEAAAKALQERAAGHYRNGDDELQDECLQCASMLHDMKPALAAPSPQVADIAELPLPWRERFHAEGNCLPIQECMQQEIDALRDAIAASRHAADGDGRLNEALSVCGTIAASDIGAEGTRAALDCISGIRDLMAAPASAGQATPAPEGLRQAVYMALHYYMSVQEPNEWEATDAAIEAMQKYLAAQPAEGAGQAGQVANECETCSGSGIVGFPPDQYEHCTDCATERAAAPAEQPSAQVKP